MNWHVTFYNDKVEQATLSFPPGILANFLHLAEMIEEFGPALGLPYSKSLGDGLFEIRAKGKERKILFLYRKGKEVIILHSFIKKTQKTPKNELATARKRLKEVKS
nr:type II toxin-antitoxin system RelE/ParE family toxin [uncultured Desulfobulbus sp.]